MGDTEYSRYLIRDYVRLLVGERDPMQAFATHFGPGLMQHDPDIGDGDDGDEEFLEGRREEASETVLPTDEFATVVHLMLAQDDLVMMKSHVFIGKSDKGRVFVDIWRVENNKFAEHWSAIEPITETENPLKIWCNQGGDYEAAVALGNTASDPICGTPGDAALRDSSLATVRSFLEMIADPNRISEAVETYMSEDFEEYSPRVGAQGKQALIEHLKAANERGETFKEARFMADGRFVLFHGKGDTGENPLGYSQMHLYKVVDGKIDAHWAVRQGIPPYSVSGRSMVDGPLEEGRKKGPPPPGTHAH